MAIEIFVVVGVKLCALCCEAEVIAILPGACDSEVTLMGIDEMDLVIGAVTDAALGVVMEIVRLICV